MYKFEDVANSSYSGDMKMERAESSRVHKEMERFYASHPNYRIQANHQIFIDYAEQSGGSELLTAENMSLWLDVLKGQLAVLRETPDEALNSFMQDNPALDCGANRTLIAERVHQTNSSVSQAVQALGSRLAFNKDAHADHTAQLEQQAAVRNAEMEQYERNVCIEEIALDWSRDAFSQNVKRAKLNYLPTEMLRSQAQEVRDRRALRGLNAFELREHLSKARAQTTPAPAVELPAEYTRETIKAMSPDEIRKLVRVYGNDQVNRRLGYVKPEIGGFVREILV